MNWIVPVSLDEFRTPMTSLFDSMIAEFFKPVDPFRSFSSDVKTRSYPKVDVRQDNADLIFEAALPFVKKEDLDIGIKGGTLTISGKVQKDETFDEGNFIKRELVRSSFARSFPLHDKMHSDWEKRGGQVSADLTEGVLTVRLIEFFDPLPGSVESGKDVKKIDVS
jgi:HSP20 family molecular chaperone IbpA